MKTTKGAPSENIPEDILERWEARGISRRSFLKFCTAMTATLDAAPRTKARDPIT